MFGPRLRRWRRPSVGAVGRDRWRLHWCGVGRALVAGGGRASATLLVLQPAVGLGVALRHSGSLTLL
jgi:hypothetical protein